MMAANRKFGHQNQKQNNPYCTNPFTNRIHAAPQFTGSKFSRFQHFPLALNSVSSTIAVLYANRQ